LPSLIKKLWLPEQFSLLAERISSLPEQFYLLAERISSLPERFSQLAEQFL